VVGGLLMATVATLFFVPVVFRVPRRKEAPRRRVAGAGYQAAHSA